MFNAKKPVVRLNLLDIKTKGKIKLKCEVNNLLKKNINITASLSIVPSRELSVKKEKTFDNLKIGAKENKFLDFELAVPDIPVGTIIFSVYEDIADTLVSKHKNYPNTCQDPPSISLSK